MKKANSYSNPSPDLPSRPLTRGFADVRIHFIDNDGISWLTSIGKPTAEIDLVKLTEKIKPMEQTEMTLAKKYGIPVQSGALDSDDVFRKAEMLGDAKSSRILSELRKHRAEIASIKRFLATRPPSPATPAGMHSVSDSE